MSNWSRSMAVLGIPDLPMEAFKEEVKGHIKPHFGGGQQQQAPTSTTNVNTNVPEYARPYVEQTLGKAAALTDINRNPYQAYQGEQVAGFTPMQEQAFQGAANLTPATQTAQASGLTGAASLQALGTNYGPSQFQGGQWGQPQAMQYMDPYLQSALMPQLQANQRMADIAAQQQQGAMAKAGAFGGGRDAIMRAEAAKNLAALQSSTVGQGLSAAYTNAQQAYQSDAQRALAAQQAGEQSRQFGANLGMQGLQTALQGAGQLGQLGAQQFGQQKDILGMQSAMGAQQQALQQARNTQAMQNFAAQKNYPYQQLMFMSDLLRGTPSSSSTSTYAAPPNVLSQIGGLGTAAAGIYGLTKGAAKGGMVTSKIKRKGAGLGKLAAAKMAS